MENHFAKKDFSSVNSGLSAQELGQRGEEIACQYLEKKGYKILVRGFRYRRVEIDLIARQGSSLVFIEVKTRRHNDFGYPEEAVNNLKMRNLKAAASAFLNQSKEKFKECRFDILSITYRTQKDYQIDHFEDAF